MESVVTFLQDVVPQVTFLCHVFTRTNSSYKWHHYSYCAVNAGSKEIAVLFTVSDTIKFNSSQNVSQLSPSYCYNILKLCNSNKK